MQAAKFGVCNQSAKTMLYQRLPTKHPPLFVPNFWTTEAWSNMPQVHTSAGYVPNVVGDTPGLLQFFFLHIHHTVKQRHLSNGPGWHQAPSRSGWPKMMAVRTDGLICCNCPGKHVFQPIKHASIPGQVTRTQTKFATILDWNQTIRPKRIASVGTFDDRHLRTTAVANWSVDWQWQTIYKFWYLAFWSAPYDLLKECIFLAAVKANLFLVSVPFLVGCTMLPCFGLLTCMWMLRKAAT